MVWRRLFFSTSNFSEWIDRIFFLNCTFSRLIPLCSRPLYQNISLRMAPESMFDLRRASHRALPNLQSPGPTARDVADGSDSAPLGALFLIPVILVLGILLAFWSVSFPSCCWFYLTYPALVIVYARIRELFLDSVILRMSERSQYSNLYLSLFHGKRV